jgi:hypothetical protein
MEVSSSVVLTTRMKRIECWCCHQIFHFEEVRYGTTTISDHWLARLWRYIKGEVHYPIKHGLHRMGTQCPRCYRWVGFSSEWGGRCHTITFY